MGAPILCSVDGHISILCVAQGFPAACRAARQLAASCEAAAPQQAPHADFCPSPCQGCSCCRTRHQSIHSFSGPKGHIQVCAGGGQSCTRAGHYALRRQNEARMTNERSQRCRSFPAQCPHRFLCKMVILCTFIGVILHLLFLTFAQTHTSMAPLASGPCLERSLQTHITTDKQHTSYHCELQRSALLLQYVCSLYLNMLFL